MSTGLPSDEVAEDYAYTLKDLTSNDRYAISNLTVIAKENTEHALAISKVLESHIRSTPPDRKLPALYVLDSVVKNVGTPYTLFLGRNLYQTFMNAYSLVDNQVRKKLNEMLETWKNPVPGSIEKRPVFPPDITRPIENALIKARTVAVQLQQQQARGQHELLSRGRPPGAQSTPWRDTPTPPQNAIRYPPQPVQQNLAQHTGQNGTHQTTSPYNSYPQFISPPASSTPYQQPYPNPLQQQHHSQHQPQYPQATSPYSNSGYSHESLDSLHRDIESLISGARIEFVSNPYDLGVQTRLKALLDLQTILKSQHLPPDQLQQIRDQVTSLANTPRPAMHTIAPGATSTPIHDLTPASQPSVQPIQSANTDLSALFASGNLAGILASAARPQASPPTPSNPPLALNHSPVSVAQTITPIPGAGENGEHTLLAGLRAAGMLAPIATTPSLGAGVPVPSMYPYHPPATVKSPAVHFSTIVPLPVGEFRNDVDLTSSSLKISRPHLISKLYDARPNQCSTCGKRFLATEDGKNEKARHLDWHFRTNQRLADSAKRGQSRSWYVDELEWIRFKDADEVGNNVSSSGNKGLNALGGAAVVKHDPKLQFIPVPSDRALANAPCPICQEKFDMSFNDEVQDFVWMDAVKIGARIYHASCHAEVKKEGGSTPLRTSTPDSVLGKRKAEGTI